MLDIRIRDKQRPSGIRYGIALTSTSYGAELIRGSGVFVVNFVPHTWEDIILHCGAVSGRQENKFECK